MIIARELVDELKKIKDFDITYKSDDNNSGEIYIDYNGMIFALEHFIWEGKFCLSGMLHSITYRGKHIMTMFSPYYFNVDYNSDVYSRADDLVSQVENDIRECSFKEKLRRLINMVDSIYEDFDESEVEFIKYILQ